jgi:hypothetical protein
MQKIKVKIITQNQRKKKPRSRQDPDQTHVVGLADCERLKPRWS